MGCLTYLLVVSVVVGSLHSAAVSERRRVISADYLLPLLTCEGDSILCADMLSCVERDAICDGDIDCEDGSDEIRCHPRSPKVKCFLMGYFACANGRCTNPVDRCDGKNDCGDNSDELFCEQGASSDSTFGRG